MRNYTGPNKGIEAWRIDWLHHGPTGGCTSPRHRLAAELKYIKDVHGTTEAKNYRNNLEWLGSYPVRLR